MAIPILPTVTVRDSLFVANSADQGGGIYNAFFEFEWGTVSGTVTVRDSVFAGNTATEFGGGIAQLRRADGPPQQAAS